MKKLALCFLSALILFSACTPTNPSSVEDATLSADDVSDILSTIEVEANVTDEATSEPSPETELSPTPEEEIMHEVNQTEIEKLAQANNSFAFKLFQELKSEQENTFYSPYSLYQALTMIYAAARSGTAEQFEAVLALPWTNDQVHELSKAMNESLNAQNQSGQNEDSTFSLNIANGLWTQKDLHIEQAFLDLLANNYQTENQSIDFSQAQEAADLINSWVEEKTEGKIRDIAQPAMFNSNTSLALTNAVYFNANWRIPFNEANTQKEDFTLLDGENLQVDMMSQNENFNVLKNEKIQLVELPYAKSTIVMDLISPVDGDWDAFINYLDAEQLQAFLEQMDNNSVNLKMPKFRVETPEMDLIRPLQSLGLVDVFGMAADLSGMTGDKSQFISTLVHKAFIDVDEAGTEAAAATLAIAQAKGMFNPQPVEITFDKPFVYLIRDTETGAILFLGSLMTP